MRLKRNWRDRLRHSRSFRWSMVGVALTGLAAAFPYLFGVFDIPPHIFFGILMLIYLVSGAFNLLHNQKLDD